MADGDERSAVVLSYHPDSAVRLSPYAERELVRVFERLRLDAEFKTRSLPVAGEYDPQLGSIISTYLPLILVIAATLGKTFLEELGKDLYGFFKRQISKSEDDDRSTWPIHYVVMLDAKIDGKDARVALTFDDEPTLRIAIFRLEQHLSGGFAYEELTVDRDGYVEFAPPLCRKRYLFPIVGFAVLLLPMVWGGAVKVQPHLPEVLRFGPWPFFVVVALFFLSLVVLGVIVPCLRRQRFLRRYLELIAKNEKRPDALVN